MNWDFVPTAEAFQVGHFTLTSTIRLLRHLDHPRRTPADGVGDHRAAVGLVRERDAHLAGRDLELAQHVPAFLRGTGVEGQLLAA